jgi:serine phosphatase RsbU (regulator of sigma subunit)
VSEVVKALLASGALRVEAGQLRTSLARLEETDLPTSIVDMVLRRVSDLDAATRRVLGAAALVGTDFTLDLVASAAASPREDVFAALDVGVAQRILHPPRDDTYRFQHDRMREACARLVQDGADVHERIVRWLELQEGAADSDELVFALAEHASRAGDDARSFRRCRDAAERALARHANQQALEYDRRALAHGARSGVPVAELRAVREQMADILTQLGRYDEARAIYEELLAGATDAAGDDRRARLLSRRGGCELRAGDLAGASATLGEALALLGRRIPRRAGALAMLGARLRLWLSRLRTAIVGPVVADERRRITLDILVRLWLVLFVSDVKRVPYVSYRLLAESVPLGPSMELSRAHRHLTVALALLPRPAWKRAIRHGMRAIAIAQRASAPLEAAIAMLYTSDIFCWSARYREALPWLESAREKLAALGNMWELANTHIFSYMAYRGCGRLDDAMAHAQAMVRLGERLSASGTVANGHVKVAEILVLRGDAAGAESHLSRGLEIAEERRLNFERFQGYKVRAFARMLEGRFADARALYAAAIKLCETPGVSFFHGYVSDAYLGYAEAYLKDADYFAASGGLSGEEGRRAARYIADSLARERHLLGHLGHAYRARGLLLWRARRHRASRRAFLRAIEVLEGQERVIDVALAALDAAAALGAHFQVEALSWVKRARAIADKLRLEPVRSRCDEAMRDLGHDVAGAPAAGDGAVRALHALRELVGTSHLLMQARDPELLLERIVDASLSLLGAERAFLFIREEGGGSELAFRLGKSADGRHVSEVDARVSRSVLERVDTLGKGLAVSDTEQDQSLRERGSVQAFQVRSVLCAPLLQAGSPLGVLYLDSQITKAIFGQPELELLQSFAAQAAAALASTRQFATIERMNRELDGKVLERTRELEAANLKLEASMAELKNTTLRLAEAKREALEKELEVARRIQLSMVPGRRTVEAAAARFAGVVEPASLCGGDLWTYAEAQGDKLVLFVGDVTGHGAGAAMITTVAKSCLDTMWLEHAGKVPVEKLCATLNAVISRLAGGDLMMTAFVVEIDPSRRVLSYCSAGHNPQLLVRAGAGQPEIVALFERGLRIGDAADADFRVKTVAYQAGDRLVLYTDGLVERTDPAGTEYGTRRLQRALRARAALGAAEVLDAILDDVSAFAAGRPADDDVTLVVAELL